MKYAADEVERRLWMFSGQVYSSNGLGAWCYGIKQEMYYSTNPNWKEFQAFLQISGILDTITSEVCDDPRPMVHTDKLGLIWISERVNLKNGDTIFIICGPAYLRGHSREEVLKKLSAFELSVSHRAKYSIVLSEIPVLGDEMIGGISRMLHFTIYDEYLSSTFVQFAENAQPQELVIENIQEESGLLHAYGRRNDFERMEEVRNVLLDCVRKGIYEEKSNGTLAYNGEMNRFGDFDELRTIKNNMIIFQSQCAQAAMEGGVTVKAAMEMQNQAIGEIEKCDSIAKLANTNWDLFLGFVELVHESKKLTDHGISETVKGTMAYILNHYKEPVSLSELAREAGYSEYYLSRKFTKETGMKIQDFMKQTRIDMAKVMLVSTQKSIFQIAEELQFKSRSHFDRTFTQLAGVSPAGYRESMGQNPKK